MDSFSRQITAEVENVETALRNLEETMQRETKTVVELAAVGTFLHNVYNGIENILKQSLKQRNIPATRGENWHKELLNLSVMQGIISEDMSDELYEYLTFRHYFVHSYGFMLEEAPLEPLAQNIPMVWSRFIAELAQKTDGVV